MADGLADDRYRALVEAAPVAIFTLAVEDGSITSANPAFTHLTGWPADEARGEPMTALVHPDDGPALVSRLHQVTLGTTPPPFELRLRTSSHSFLIVELALAPQLAEGQVRQVLGFVRDVSERRAVIRDLRAAKDAAEAASEAKTEFLANMSHEIRTPLNVIVGMTSLLLDMPLEDQAKEFAHSIRSSSHTLLGLINGILDFSKIESGKLELENQPFRLRDCVRGAIDMVAAAAADKGLELGVTIADGCPAALYGDVTRVRQVLVNLLSNAVKFTDAGGVDVAVEARRVAPGDHEVVFRVRDTGAGIAADKQARIFDVFSQADASTTRRFGGTGLGLSISKRLTELMGGEIGVESAPGRGSTFRFSIRARAVRDGVRVAEPGAAAGAIDTALADKLPLRILVAEDHPVNQKLARLLLEKIGYQADVVADGEEVLAALERRRYDVVFMDIHMPVLDGVEATRRVCERWSEPERPQIVAMTASAMKVDRERCLAAGMVEFISKPIFLEEVQAALEFCAERIAAAGGQAVSRPPPSPVARRAAPAAAADPTLDPTALELLKDVDRDKLAGLVDDFLSTSRQDVERIRQAVASGDPHRLAAAAHALKGSCSVFGAARLARICADLESLGREGSTAEAGSGLAELVPEMEKVREALASFGS